MLQEFLKMGKTINFSKVSVHIHCSFLKSE